MTATQRWEAVEEMEWELGIEEVEMDVDLTEEQQVFVIAEVQKARVELKPGMTPEDLGLSQDPGSYSVSPMLPTSIYYLLGDAALCHHDIILSPGKSVLGPGHQCSAFSPGVPGKAEGLVHQRSDRKPLIPLWLMMLPFPLLQALGVLFSSSPGW